VNNSVIHLTRYHSPTYIPCKSKWSKSLFLHLEGGSTKSVTYICTLCSLWNQLITETYIIFPVKSSEVVTPCKNLSPYFLKECLTTLSHSALHIGRGLAVLSVTRIRIRQQLYIVTVALQLKFMLRRIKKRHSNSISSSCVCVVRVVAIVIVVLVVVVFGLSVTINCRNIIFKYEKEVTCGTVTMKVILGSNSLRQIAYDEENKKSLTVCNLNVRLL
jgi:hypothetical protein